MYVHMRYVHTICSCKQCIYNVRVHVHACVNAATCIMMTAMYIIWVSIELVPRMCYYIPTHVEYTLFMYMYMYVHVCDIYMYSVQCYYNKVHVHVHVLLI